MEPAVPARVERRLAAILAADVAGYSRLIQADEEGTLGRLKALRVELIDPKIAHHHGRIVKTTGDGGIVNLADPGRLFGPARLERGSTIGKQRSFRPEPPCHRHNEHTAAV